MEYRRLGKAGVKVSVLSLGSWVTFHNQVDTRLAVRCMAAAYEAGVNFFDNAESYAAGMSETIMGEALKELGWRRESYLVSSKVFWGSVENPKPNEHGLSRKHLIEACHGALRRLQVEYLDLFFCHRPDPDVPMEEIVRTMTDLVQQGKVFYWGTSEWSDDEIMDAYRTARKYGLVPPTMEQPQYSLLFRERVEEEYAPLYEEIGLGTTIWSPLASGLLTGKYNDGIPADSRLSLPGYEWLRSLLEGEYGARNLRQIRALGELAAELGTNMTLLALAWCVKNPHVSTVITGASRVEQVEENMQALDVVPKLTPDVMARIDTILAGE